MSLSCTILNSTELLQQKQEGLCMAKNPELIKNIQHGATLMINNLQNGTQQLSTEIAEQIRLLYVIRNLTPIDE